MELNQAIALISSPNIVSDKPLVCADMGCGSGLFTHALASLLCTGSSVYGVDKTTSLENSTTSNQVLIKTIRADFEKDVLPLSNLDGILMANALHYVKDKPAFISKLKKLMKPDAFFLVVEYDTDTPVARWVPYPISYAKLEALFKKAGYTNIQKLGERPSLYGHSNLYSSLILP